MDFDTATPIGQGASGEVLRAHDRSRNEIVAIKLLNSDDPQMLARMEREARAQQELTHPNICPVYAIGDYKGRRCIVMRYIDGVPIDQAARDLPIRGRIRLLRTVCDAMASAHQAGVVHRDLKPANILVEATQAGPHPWVVDFGLARKTEDATLTQHGQALGTPGYMSPEQARGAPHLDARCDVYALGVLAFELLAGHRPFHAESVAELLLKTISEDAPDVRSEGAKIPEPLARIVARCLERTPSLRYSDAAALRDDLDAWLAGRTVSARRITTWHKLRRIAARNPGASSALAALTIAALVAGAVAIFSVVSRAQYAEQQAELARQYTEVAAEFENRIRLIYARPIHDIRPAIARVEEEIQQLAARSPDNQSAAAGAVHYALGRSFFALGRYTEAQHHLQSAWNSGVQFDEVALYLGRTNLALYSDALQLARLEPSVELRASREHEFRQAYLNPGLSLLGRVEMLDGDSFSDQAALAHALSLHYQGETPQALKHLEWIAERLDWPAPAWWLAARLRIERATAGSMAEAPQEVEAELISGIADLDRALSMNRSDPRIWRDRCRAVATRLGLRAVGLPGAELGDFALESCDTLLEIDADDPQNLITVAAALEEAASMLARQNKDPAPFAERAIQMSSRAIDASPKSGEAWARRGFARISVARHVQIGGDDVRSILKMAIEDLEHAVEREPGILTWTSGLASAYSDLAREQYVREESGDEAYSRAIELLDQASDVPGSDVQLKFRLVYATTWQGYYRYLHGRPANDILERSVQLGRQLAELYPNAINAHIGIAYATWTLADYRLIQGLNPEPYISEAVNHYDRVLAIDPSRYGTRYNVLSCQMTRVLGIQELGNSAATELERLERDLNRFIEDYPEDPGLAILNSSFERRLAHEAIVTGADPRPHFRRARHYFRQIDTAALDAIEAWLGLSYTAVREHQWRIADGHVDLTLYRNDIQTLRKGLDQFPDFDSLRGEWAQLALMARDLEDLSASERNELIIAGKAALSEAIRDNVILQRRYHQLVQALEYHSPGSVREAEKSESQTHGSPSPYPLNRES